MKKIYTRNMLHNYKNDLELLEKEVFILAL